MILLTSISVRRSSAVFFQKSKAKAVSSSSVLPNWFSSMSGGGEKPKEYYTIGLTGSNGLVGTALRDELSRSNATVDGKPVRVVCLVRSNAAEAKDLSTLPAAGDTTLQWNPNGKTVEEIVHPEAAASMDAIVHLSGENVATGLGPLGFLGIRPWTDAKKKEILDSRVVTTKALAQVVAASPTPKSFLVASGVGAYGDQFVIEPNGSADDVSAADESTDTSQARGFLAEVSRQWEAASDAAKSKSGHRVVNMRFGVLMSTKGGALEKLYPIFFMGGGGNVGSGRQYFPFISARDHARAMVHTLQTPSLEGPVNFCSPQPCTNAEFTTAFGSCLNRPTILPFPSFAVQTLFGEMGTEMLLGGTKARPKKLLDSGFTFQHPTIKEALASALKESI
eukprot:CAMPEP_0172476094 /NCGR_PEP_ID=MMETSP1065-20121228/70203_1 /TAXON_ID=265537 /ORGANISM="Amphiprora paludosa, Strain CCMP125" /LENGTH=392 /DNA_ID=CAMNT_0013234311 /DNA_START=55 /DNA_END=1233 /DNA_ORIENTATION=-